MIDNKLSLHLGKTESILFGSKKKLKRANKISVQCSGSIIESKASVTYLGLTLDQATSGEAIATKVLNKCASRIKFLYRNTRFFKLKY